MLAIALSDTWVVWLIIVWLILGCAALVFTLLGHVHK